MKFNDMEAIAISGWQRGFPRGTSATQLVATLGKAPCKYLALRYIIVIIENIQGVFFTGTPP